MDVRVNSLSRNQKGTIMATQVQQLDQERDGIRYTIFVERDDGAMWGTWSCGQCGSGGSSPKTSATMGDAVRAAQNEIDRHHSTNHQVSQ
jgi:hypothetical protein